MYINNDINYMKWLLDKNIIIFGAGKIGIKAYENFKRTGFHITAFCDNDLQKQGSIIDGIVVLSFAEAEKLLIEKKIYVIASDLFEAEIKQQLMEKSGGHFISVKQIDFSYCDVQYYDSEYFLWQKRIGEVACKFDITNFEKYINKDDIVIEFGSGGGYLLNIIEAKEKIGIEINKYARENASRLGIKSVENIDEIVDSYADIIISTHALEHVDEPLKTIKQLKEKLKENGKIVFMVPYQGSCYEYVKNDINNELYNWNCITLGNLFKRAGFFVKCVKRVLNQLPPEFIEILEETGEATIDVITALYSQYSKSESILILAEK